MAEPFTIRIFVPDGDPEGLRIIDRLNWTGCGIVFPRARWGEIRQRKEFATPGVYILVGAEDDSDQPRLYVGQGDGLRDRIDSHEKQKAFWDWAAVFVSSSGALNRAHITWLEYALIARAQRAGRCRLDNGNAPQEPALSDAERADTQAFLNEILQILPLVNLRVFEIPKAVARPASPARAGHEDSGAEDTVIVPARRKGFEKVFLGENCWHEIRIAGGRLQQIRYVAAYQSKPVSAVTHYAPVQEIVPYGNGGKYKLIFAAKAKPLNPPVPLGDAKPGAMQGPRYTSLAHLLKAKKLTDLDKFAEPPKTEPATAG